MPESSLPKYEFSAQSGRSTMRFIFPIVIASSIFF